MLNKDADGGYTPEVFHNALGSVGKLTIQLWQTEVSGVWTDLRYSKTCLFVVLEDGSESISCEDPDPAEDLVAGPVLMRCQMRSAGAGPPTGPWGCEADVAA